MLYLNKALYNIINQWVRMIHLIQHFYYPLRSMDNKTEESTTVHVIATICDLPCSHFLWFCRNS